MHVLARSRLILMAAAVGLSIAACGGGTDDLDAYINDVKARPGGRIEPLPEITPYEGFAYVADAEGLRSPFVPDTPQAAQNPNSTTRPDLNRSREFLEQFPLDSLRMVGTLDLGGINYGLIQDSDGLIHRVIPGNYLGQNDGRIVGITESEIQVVEIISDGIGGYLEREAAVALND